VQLELETRGPDHIREVVQTLRRHDYPVS
jgi:hypothetical protein